MSKRLERREKTMLEILQYGFMQRALLAGVVAGALCPLIGIFLVLRRMSLIGDSLSHIALSGIAAGILMDVYPMGTALLFSVGAALAIERLRKAYAQYAELAIAVLLSGGIGTAVVLIGFAKGMNIDLFSYLFGSIATVLKEDLVLIFLLGIWILLSVKFLYKELFYIAFDEEAARLAGIPVKWINRYFIILVAMTITLSMRVIGILLVSSLIVLPVATSLQVAKNFKQAAFLSVFFAEIAVISGIFISYYLEIASGGTIVLISVILLVFVLSGKGFLKRIRGIVYG